MSHRLSSPFNLRERLSAPSRGLICGLALTSVLLVAAFMAMMSSEYIYAPGLTLEIKENVKEAGQYEGESFQLPVSSLPLSGQKTGAVLTVKSDSMFICDGKIHTKLDTALPPSKSERGILLVKIDKNASVQSLFDLKKYAIEAGFSGIQIAGEESLSLE